MAINNRIAPCAMCLCATTTQLLRLHNTEQMLQRHISFFKYCMLFIISVILLLAVVVIIMAVKFPAAVAPSEYSE